MWSDTSDDCPTEAGNSTEGGLNACPDMDGDGWADSIDDCQWIQPFGAIQTTMAMVTTLVVTLLMLVLIHLERQPLIASDVWMLMVMATRRQHRLGC